MATIVFFHHVLGLTDGVVALADQVRSSGHTVHTPDLFEGQTFDTIESGAAYVDQIGFAAIADRGVAAAAGLGEGLVFAGVSLGVVPAQRLAQTRPDARGAILLEACVQQDAFADGWPSSVPVQIHGMADDPFFAGEGDIDAAREIVDGAPDGVGELFVYDGDDHLFTDSSVPAHDPGAAALVIGRILTFLANA